MLKRGSLKVTRYEVLRPISCVEEPSTYFHNNNFSEHADDKVASCYFGADEIFNSIYLKLLFINNSN